MKGYDIDGCMQTHCGPFHPKLGKENVDLIGYRRCMFPTLISWSNINFIHKRRCEKNVRKHLISNLSMVSFVIQQPRNLPLRSDEMSPQQCTRADARSSSSSPSNPALPDMKLGIIIPSDGKNIVSIYYLYKSPTRH